MGQNNLIFDVDIPLLEKILKAFCRAECTYVWVVIPRVG